MLLESMILMTCAQGKGCTEATTAYYQSNKELQAVVNSVSTYGQKLTNEVVARYPAVVYAAAPIYTIAIDRKGSFALYKSLMLEVDLRTEFISLKYSF